MTCESVDIQQAKEVGFIKYTITSSFPFKNENDAQSIYQSTIAVYLCLLAPRLVWCFPYCTSTFETFFSLKWAVLHNKYSKKNSSVLWMELWWILHSTGGEKNGTNGTTTWKDMAIPYKDEWTTCRGAENINCHLIKPTASNANGVHQGLANAFLIIIRTSLA